MSDLHVEFGGVDIDDNVDCDVVVLAGDIDMIHRTNVPKWARETFPKREIVWVPGNHEYYRANIFQALRIAHAQAKGYGVHLLEKRSIEIGGVRFLGCTLWTDFNLLGDVPSGLAAAQRGMSDFRVIRISHGEDELPLSPEDTVVMHRGCVSWLDRTLEEDFIGPTVVVTHHGPHPKCSHPHFAGDALAPAYCSDLTWLIEKHRPKLWVSGHTHANHLIQIGKTVLVSNQRGYSNTPEVAEAPFVPTLVIEVTP